MEGGCHDEGPEEGLINSWTGHRGMISDRL